MRSWSQPTESTCGLECSGEVKRLWVWILAYCCVEHEVQPREHQHAPTPSHPKHNLRKSHSHLRPSARTGKDSSMTNLANFRTSAVDA
jgi:hypothetical protein